MKLESNNNQRIVNHLAKQSVKGNRMRNFFILFTIALSVSLITFMALFTMGVRKSYERKVEHMQHVIYYDVTKEQLGNLAKDEQVSCVAKMKTGPSIEVEDYILSFQYMEESRKELEMLKLSEGKMPQKEDEIAVPKSYLKRIGKPEKLGTKLSFTFLDGTTETFTVTGFLKEQGKSKVYSIVLSEQYAENGSQLSQVPYTALVRIHNAKQYDQTGFLNEIRDLASKYGIERKQVNENNAFLKTLSGDPNALQQTVMVIVIGIGILFVSVLVIYSVFYLSVIGRIRQFGQLSTIGMTRKQIRKMIRREGILLSMRGIPIGLLLGAAEAYLAQRDGWDWKNTIVTVIGVTIADLITVLISIRKPAKLASAISPIEAAKYSGETEKQGKKETKKLYRKLSPIRLAKLNSERNRKKSMLTMISLGVGGILFMLGATFIEGTSLDEYARSGEFSYGEYQIGFSSNAVETMAHGRTGIQMKNPLSLEFVKQIEQIEGVKKVHRFERAEVKWEANGENVDDSVNTFSEKILKDMNRAMGTSLDYAEMAQKKELIINKNDLVQELFGWEFTVGDKIEITFFNGTENVTEEFTVAGILPRDYEEPSPEWQWLILPEQSVKEIMGNINLTDLLSVSTEKEKEKAVGKAIRELVEENPLLAMETIEEERDKVEEQFHMLHGTMLGLSAFIILFSLLNLLNTLITNMVTRKQEFAMLQSIGMSEKQLYQMVQSEGILLAGGNVLLTLVGGTLGGIGMIEIMRHFEAEYMHYHFPLWYFLVYTVLLVVIPIIVSRVVFYFFKKEALVERIRNSD